MLQDTRSTQKKSVALLYTNDKEAKKEIREIPPFTIATNNRKYLGVTANDLFSKNFKSLKKVTEKDTRNLPYCQIGKIYKIKMAILPKEIYRFSAIPIKISVQFFTDLERTITNYIWKNSGQPKQSCTIKELLEASLSMTSNSTPELQ